MKFGKRVFRYTLIGACASAGVLLFILASAAGNTALFERHYTLLLWLNGLLMLLLLVLVGIQLRRLAKRYRAGAFGTRLMLRFAAAFTLMGVLPGALIYLMSVQFLSKSLESWFNVRVEKALESGLTLGRSALDTMLREMEEKARVMAVELSEQTDSAQIILLSRMREQSGVQELVLVNQTGRVLASAGNYAGKLLPDLPSQQILRQARSNRLYRAIENEGEDHGNNLRLRVVITVDAPRMLSLNQFGMNPDNRYLQLLQAVPVELSTNVSAVESVNQDYQTLSLSRSGLRKIYGVTLTMTLLLAILASIATAILLATSLAEPLLRLAQGTKAVAEGDFRPMEERSSNDELGLLTRSFNAMTRQLNDARTTVERNQQALEHAKTYLESILGNLSAGVMVFDQEFRLVTTNQSAERIFGLPPQELLHHLGDTLEQSAQAAQTLWLQDFAQKIRQAFAESSALAEQEQHWQKQIELKRLPQPSPDTTAHAETLDVEPLPLILLVRGSRLPVRSESGYVVAFDDITEVISTQRSAAWGEVARRLAHEIKNPLTPIQLSAERLQMKLQNQLSDESLNILNRATNTIVNQVTAMKRMVDEFRDYARLPPAQLQTLDLNALIRDVLNLYGDAYEQPASQQARIIADLMPDLPSIQGDATQLRQLIHNLLQNAQDAMSSNTDPNLSLPERHILISTRIIANDRADSSWVRLRVDDQGNGFPAKILNRAFEPYVTTKAKGTGLGLAIVKKIVDEHHGRVDLQNRAPNNTQPGGARVSILLPTTEVHSAFGRT